MMPPTVIPWEERTPFHQGALEFADRARDWLGLGGWYDLAPKPEPEPPPVYYQPGPGNWYEQSGLQWEGQHSVKARDPQGESPSVLHEVALSDWQKSYWDSPKAFYDYYDNAYDNSTRDAWLFNLQDTYKATKAKEAGRDASITTLQGTDDDIVMLQQAFAANPDREMFEAALRRRMDPGYSMFSDVQRASYDNKIAKNLALSKQGIQGYAAGRGGAGSGLELGSLGQQDSIAASGALGVAAGMDEADARARLSAEGVMGGELAARENRDVALQNMRSGIASRIAGYESGVDYTPTDALPYAALQHSIEAYDQEFERLLASDAALREEEKVGIWDALETASGVFASGMPKQLYSFFEKQFPGPDRAPGA